MENQALVIRGREHPFTEQLVQGLHLHYSSCWYSAMVNPTIKIGKKDNEKPGQGPPPWETTRVPVTL